MQGPDPVHLLGEVGKAEVGDESPNQTYGRGGVELVEQRRGSERVLAAAGPHLLDEIQELLSLLSHQDLTEKSRHQTHIPAHGRVVERRIGHRASMPGGDHLLPRLSYRSPSRDVPFGDRSPEEAASGVAML